MRRKSGWNKFKAVRTKTTDGVTHDSKREAKRWAELKLLERAGEIRDLERQVRVYLRGHGDLLRKDSGLPMSTVIDFRYFDERLKCVVYEDSKGIRTRDWAVRRAVLAAMGVDVREV